MKLLQTFLKTTKEQLRIFWDIILLVSLAPMFVFLYWSFFGASSSTSYSLLVYNQDQGICEGIADVSCADLAIQEIEKLQYTSGDPILIIKPVQDLETAEKMLRDRDGTALIMFPENFSEELIKAKNTQQPADCTITFKGDLTNTYYSVAAIFTNAGLTEFIGEVTNRSSLINIAEEPMGSSGAKTELDLYIPGLIIVAICMLVFSVSMTIAREVETGSIRRLMLSKINSFEYLGGISLYYVIVGLISVVFTFIVAKVLGFNSSGSILLAGVICLITCMAVIATGLITGCFAKTAVRASLISMIPLMLFMFFSGAVFPISVANLFEINGIKIGIFDFLPTTHAVSALNKIFTLGAGFTEITYEFGMICFLTILYFVIGVLIFKKTQMKS